ncbi:DUF1659 domain-containing protein [Peribacillus kribbensis]|uniref:DUF1659 domain-containing protein n=1 Tax=Peribacillus kribbensis TaxID=356658 RepID=UPI0004067CEA|nr:DUF1659 domain-containing protein [Peribacillus kribbensis]
MANQTLVSSTLQYSVQTGLNDKNEPVLKKKTLPNVKPAATPDQLYQTASALAGLSRYPLADVSRGDLQSVNA